MSNTEVNTHLRVIKLKIAVEIILLLVMILVLLALWEGVSVKVDYKYDENTQRQISEIHNHMSEITTIQDNINDINVALQDLELID